MCVVTALDCVGGDDMTDRENVIKELTNLPTTIYDGFYQLRITHDLRNKVIALLEEQETELSFRNAKPITHIATKLDDATCPSCGNVVGEKIRTGAIGQSVVQVRWNYCRSCGQKLDWEGR